MLLQTNSYIVPKEKRAEHSRLIRRFRQTLLRLGCDHFEVYEQVGSNWSNSESAGRYVQILRFLDRKHQLAVQAAERSDPTAQAVIADFCDLINFPYQQQQGLFAVGFYTSVLPVAPKRGARGELVSTVEHEVIDDPEAEKPYPGASDGPPVEESAVEAESSMVTTESLSPEPATGEAVGVVNGTEFEPDEILHPSSHVPHAEDEPETFSSEPIPTETVVTEAEEHRDVLETRADADALVHEPHAAAGHAMEEPSHTDIEETTSRAEKTDDFMSLVGGELDTDANGADLGENPFDEESDDDAAHGFIEVDMDDAEIHDPHGQSVEPAHPHSKDRPPGW